jgi:hypothetical protein
MGRNTGKGPGARRAKQRSAKRIAFHRFRAKTQGGSGTEFIPPSKSKVVKRKRTVYRKTSHEF